MAKNLISTRLYKANTFYKYQFYEGKATYDSDYKNRLSLMEKEVEYATNYMNKIGSNIDTNVGTLDKGFEVRLLELAKKSFQEEKILYDNLKLNYNDISLILDKDSLQSDLNKIIKLGNEITLKFNPPDSDKIAFLNKMNDRHFLNFITMEKYTELSFYLYGKKENKNNSKRNAEERGKYDLTKALNTALNQTGSRKTNYRQVLKLLEKDFINLNAELFESDDFLEDVYNIIEETLDETMPKALRNMLSEQRFKSLFYSGKDKERATIKRFYKTLYRKMEKLTKTQSDDRKYLNGALQLSETIYETNYGVGVLREIYPEIMDKPTNSIINQDLDFEKMSIIFVDFLRDQLEKQKSSSTDIQTNEQAISFIDKNRENLIGIIKFAYSKNSSNEKKLRELAKFSKSAVSGLLGEIASAISISSNNMQAIITGGQRNNMGQQIAVDVNLEIINADGTTKVLGLQVKNYTSRGDFSLYSDTNISLTSSSIYKYLTNNDIKVLKFLIANLSFINDFMSINLSSLDLENFLQAFLSSFLRIEDMNDNTGLVNSFYYINNKIVPSSALLIKLILEAEQIIKDKTTKKLIQILNLEKGINYEDVPSDAEIFNYYTMSDQPKAIIRGKIQPARAISLDSSGNNIYPKKIELLNDELSDVRIAFRGLRINLV